MTNLSHQFIICKKGKILCFGLVGRVSSIRYFRERSFPDNLTIKLSFNSFYLVQQPCMALVTFSNKRRTFWSHYEYQKSTQLNCVLYCIYRWYFFCLFDKSSIFSESGLHRQSLYFPFVSLTPIPSNEETNTIFLHSNQSWLSPYYSLSIISNLLGDNHTLCFVKLAMSIFSSLLFQFFIARLYAIIINDALLYNGSFAFYSLTKWYVVKYIKIPYVSKDSVEKLYYLVFENRSIYDNKTIYQYQIVVCMLM